MIGYHDFSREHYDSDPCPGPSLTARDIRMMTEASPAHMAARHPRLTLWPDWIEPTSRGRDFGTIVKRLILNRGHDVEPLPFDDFTTKQAKFRKAQAEADGKIVTTTRIFARAMMIAEAVVVLHDDWKKTASDVTKIWRDDPTSIWHRTFIDAAAVQRGTAFFVETVNGPLSKDERAKLISNRGIDYEMAMLGPDARCVIVELAPPFHVYIDGLNDGWYFRLYHLISKAREKFALGLQSGQWAYRDSGALLSLPAHRDTEETRRSARHVD